MRTTAILILFSVIPFFGSSQDAKDILKRVDENMTAKTRIFESTMIIHGKRNSRSISSRSYSEGDDKSMTEYLTPAREQGTKMLKLKDQLWIYSPSTDRTIQISGHLLRQSVMGSDLSYEDMMVNKKLTDMYEAKVADNDVIDGRKVIVLELDAKTDDIAYQKRKMWIDAERYIAVKEEFYARSGQLLKRTTLTDVKQIQGRWFPMSILYKDMLREGKGTEFKISSVKFDQDIPSYIFTKASLKK